MADFLFPDEEPAKAKKIAVRLILEGRVQNVSFREWMKKQANALNVCGWVRNRTNESLEALLIGDEEKVQKLIQLSHIGPPMAQVKRLKEFPQTVTTVPKGFQILPLI